MILKEYQLNCLKYKSDSVGAVKEFGELDIDRFRRITNLAWELSYMPLKEITLLQGFASIGYQARLLREHFPQRQITVVPIQIFNISKIECMFLLKELRSIFPIGLWPEINGYLV